MESILYSKIRNNIKLIQITGFNYQLFKRIKVLSKSPIVIGGCGRSGTTLLLSILSCHPNVTAFPGETSCLAPKYWEYDYKGFPQLERIYKYLCDGNFKEETSRWCEKTPRNIRYVNYIFSYFGEGVRFINIVRDGRDVITSKHPKRPAQYYVKPKRWIEDVREGVKWEGDPRFMTIRYEDLIYSYKKTMKNVCEFIEERFTKSLLNYPKSAALQRSMAWKTKARPISDKSIGRWKNKENSDLLSTFMSNPEVLKLMKYYDYV